MSTLSFADLEAAPGERVQGYTSVTVCDVTVRLPVYLINGTGDGPLLVVSAGIHGGEYPCVEAATRLGRAVDPSQLNGQLLVLPSANPVAFRARSIYVTPVDGLNLNRQFPGDPEGSFTRAWAAWLFENAISRGDMYIDMHGGDMIEALVPFVSFNLTGNEEVDATARRMAEAYGIRAMLVKRNPGPLAGTTYAAAAGAGVPGLLTEAGGQGVWDEEGEVLFLVTSLAMNAGDPLMAIAYRQ